MAEDKRFDDWLEVDCNQCSHYWDNSCDGVRSHVKGCRKPCNAFLATRSIEIPQEINRLKRAFKRALWALAILGVSTVAIWLWLIFSK